MSLKRPELNPYQSPSTNDESSDFALQDRPKARVLFRTIAGLIGFPIFWAGTYNLIFHGAGFNLRGQFLVETIFGIFGGCLLIWIAAVGYLPNRRQQKQAKERQASSTDSDVGQ